MVKYLVTMMVCFLNRLLTLAILFSTALTTAVVAEPVILGISLLISVVLAL